MTKQEYAKWIKLANQKVKEDFAKEAAEVKTYDTTAKVIASEFANNDDSDIDALINIAEEVEAQDAYSNNQEHINEQSYTIVAQSLKGEALKAHNERRRLKRDLKRDAEGKITMAKLKSMSEEERKERAREQRKIINAKAYAKRQAKKEKGDF